MTTLNTRAIVASAAAVASLFAGGCATITRGTSTDVLFQSEPPGAAMNTSHGFSCTTPCTLDLRREDAFTATFSLPGYHDEQVVVESRVGGGGAAGMAGNLVFGGVVGGVIDATSGAMNDLIPNPVIATLTPITAAVTAAPATAPASGE